MSGAAAERALVLTASGRRRPALDSGSVVMMLSNVSGTSPESTSFIAGAAPLYGTCVSVMPALEAKYSMKRCAPEPLPALAALSDPGAALAAASRSASVLIGELAFTTRRNGADEICVT